MHTQKTYIDYIHTFTYTFSPSINYPDDDYIETATYEPKLLSQNTDTQTQTHTKTHTQTQTHTHIKNSINWKKKNLSLQIFP